MATVLSDQLLDRPQPGRRDGEHRRGVRSAPAGCSGPPHRLLALVVRTLRRTQRRRRAAATVALAFGAVAWSGAGVALGALPARNGKIAFVSTRDGNREIYVMNADGSGQTNLTNHTGLDGSPAVSPDGSKIAFDTTRNGDYEIYVMNADGSGQTNLTNSPQTSEPNPAFSPDGSKIAFESYRNGNWDLYVMNADGSGQTRLTSHPALDLLAAFSPDGSKIAFWSGRDGNWEIYVMNADGSGQTNLTNNAAYDGSPAFSPDGSKLVFDSYRDGNYEVYVMNADGSGQTRLTNHPAVDEFPEFSPDGSKIAFDSTRDGNLEVYVMNADGSGQTRLTSHPADDFEADWAAAGATCTQPAATSLPVVVSSGTNWQLRNSLTTGGATTTFSAGTRPVVPFASDWDSTGSRTPGTYSSGVLRLYNEIPPEASPTQITFGDARGFPVAGDFDGDCRDDVAIYSNGTWQIHFADDGASEKFSFGGGSWPATVPVAGDWDGDGIDGIGTYTLASGTWNLRQTASGGAPEAGSFVFWTGSGSYPVVGDWDADRDDTVGVKNGPTWSLNNQNDTSPPDVTFQYGVANDLPLTWKPAPTPRR